MKKFTLKTGSEIHLTATPDAVYPYIFNKKEDGTIVQVHGVNHHIAEAYADVVKTFEPAVDLAAGAAAGAPAPAPAPAPATAPAPGAKL